MKRIRLKKRFIIFVLLVVLVVVGVTMCFLKIRKETHDVSVVSGQIELSVIVGGNLVIHDSLNEAAYNEKNETYNYEAPFSYVKKYIEGADFAMCDLETTFVGPPYKGYPLFKSPDSLGADLKNIGFDVIFTSSNHAYDSGDEGVLKTHSVLTQNGLKVAGTRETVEDERFVLVEAKGVTLAVLSYTTSGKTFGQEDLNGNILSSEGKGRINTFSKATIDDDMKEISQEVKKAKDAGADIVLMHYHWGEEYENNADSFQKKVAQRTVDEADVDIIVGTHPHVPQEKEIIIQSKSGKKVPVYYSLGNLYSNQREELLGNNPKVEEGILASFNIIYDKEKNQISEIKEKEIPFWVDKYEKDGKINYAIIPLVEGYENNEALKESGHVKKATKALEDLNGIFGITQE